LFFPWIYSEPMIGGTLAPEPEHISHTKADQALTQIKVYGPHPVF